VRTIKGRMKGGHWALAREEYEEVWQALDAGKLIVYPTDTLYGLGCDPFEGPSVERVFEMKRRPADQPIALALTSRDHIPKYAHVTPLAQRVIANHLPGPVTILLRAGADAPAPLVSSTGLLGIRVPDHTVAIAIAKAFGPITTTSANLHGGSTPVTAEDAPARHRQAGELVLRSGRPPGAHGPPNADRGRESLRG